MQEIWIPLFFITLFLFLYTIRSSINKLRTIAGLTWFPLISFLTAILLFPAYGFRPEVIPLLIHAAILSIISISKNEKDSSVYRSIKKTSIIRTLPPMIILAAAAGIAFYYTPQKDTSLAEQNVYSLKATDLSGTGEREYFIRIYADKNKNLLPSRPLLVLLPPALGSIAAADEVSMELHNRGFTVLTYSRRGFDSPAVYFTGEGKKERYGIRAVEWFRRIHAFVSGTNSASANNKGRALEDARTEDLFFILSWIRRNPLLEGRTPLFNIASRNAVFLAGYDAGGGALILAGNSLLPESLAGIKILGLIAIDSYLWSVYRRETPDVSVLPPDADWLTSVQHGLNRWFLNIRPRHITGFGQIPRLTKPVLFLVSEKERSSGSRRQAMLSSFEIARGPTLMISADGAGPFAYSDLPVKYPILAALLRGQEKPAWNNLNAPSRTAGIITGFAASVLNSAGEDSSILENTPLPAGIQITPNSAWPPIRQLPND